MIDITKIKNIDKGLYVEIIDNNKRKHKGYVREIISKGNDKNGIRVIIASTLTNTLTEGTIISIPSKSEVQKEMFKYYNIFFNSKEFFSIIDENGNYYILKLGNKSNAKLAVTIFTNSKEAKQFIESLENNSLKLKRISSKNLLINNFSKIQYNCFILEGKKIVSKIKFEELEKYFDMHE